MNNQDSHCRCGTEGEQVTRNGALLPREAGPFISGRTYRQAATLIANLVKSSSESLADRAKLARYLIIAAQPLAFALVCLHRLKGGEERDDSERVLSDEAEQELGLSLADRARNAARLNPPYKEDPDYAPWLLSVWNEYGSPGEVGAFLRQQLEHDGTQVDDFLAAYVTTTWSNSIPRKSDFDMNSYKYMAEVIDPDLVMEKLQRRYGAELENPMFRNDQAMELNRRLAHQFSYVHQKSRAEKAANENTDEL